MYSWDPQIMKQYMGQCTHLVLCKGMSNTAQGRLKCPAASNPPKLPKEGSTEVSLSHQPHGFRANVGLLQDQFYWPRMTKDVELHIAKCDQCICVKNRPPKAAMENIQATHPLQLVHLDYLTIKVTEDGKDVPMLIITDHFTWYTQAQVTSSQTAKCTAQTLWDGFIVHYGLLESTVSDQGQNFKIDLITELCKLAKVQILCASPYHSQTNGQCKCFNHALINKLGTIPPNKKSHWRDMVPVLVHVYNCTRSTATGFSQYYLMYGQNSNCQLIYTLVPKEWT